MLTQSNWLLSFISIVVVILTGCNRVLSTSTPIYTIAPTIELPLKGSPQEPRLIDCQMPPASGLPVGDGLKNSHILYQAGPNIDSIDQVWSYQIKDNTHKLVLNHLPYPYYPSGFLLDGFHIVLVDHNRFWLSNLNGLKPSLIDSNSTEFQSLLATFPKSSRIWRFYNSIDLSKSPDGNKSAVWHLGDPNLVLTNHQTGEKVNVIKYNNTGSISGSWSPDGSLYAISYSNNFKGEKSKIYIVHADGTGLKMLAEFERLDISRPYWSPDGQKIVFASHAAMSFRPTVYQVVSIATGTVNAFAIDTEESRAWFGSYDVVWSPDSQWFLFFTQKYDSGKWNYDIEALNLSSGELYCITDDHLVKTNADWR